MGCEGRAEGDDGRRQARSHGWEGSNFYGYDCERDEPSFPTAS